MKQKTSCFNTTLFRKNFVRFWPIWVIYLLVLILMMPVCLFNQAASSKAYSLSAFTDSQGLDVLASTLNSGLMLLPVCIFSVIAAAAVFSYLYNARSCYMIHALPLNRNELFFTNYLSGFLFLAGPQIITFLLSMIVCIVQNITHVEYLFNWLVFIIGITFFLYTLSVFCCMLTGHLCAVFIFFLIINFAYQCARFFVSTVISSVCFGMRSYGDLFFYSDTADKGSYLAPLYYLDQTLSVSTLYDSAGIADRLSFSGGKTIILYCAVAAVLLIISVIFYRRRKLETAGDIIAVPWLIPIFRWLVALFGGFCVGTVISQLLNTRKENYFLIQIVSTVIFTLVFFYIAQMILSKKFRIFKLRQLPECIICVAVMLLFLSGIRADWYNIEDYIPEQSQISSVIFANSNDIIANDAETIQKILDIHQTIIDRKEAYRKYNYASNQTATTYDIIETDDNDTADMTTLQAEEKTATLYITYYLKNGSQVSRTYTIPVSREEFDDVGSAASLTAELQSDTDYFFQYTICANYKDASIKDGSLSLLDSDYNEQTCGLSQEDAERIWKAYQKDASEGCLGISVKDEEITDDTLYYNTLSLYLYCENGFQSIYDRLPNANTEYGIQTSNGVYYPESAGNQYVSTTYTAYLPLNSNCVNTLAVIDKLGILNDGARLVTNAEYYEATGYE